MDYPQELKHFIDLIKEYVDDSHSNYEIDEPTLEDFFKWLETEQKEKPPELAKISHEQITEYIKLANEEWEEGWHNAMYYQGLGEC
jgi:hypothetical protein